jgi:hypothetical protein
VPKVLFSRFCFLIQDFAVLPKLSWNSLCNPLVILLPQPPQVPEYFCFQRRQEEFKDGLDYIVTPCLKEFQSLKEIVPYYNSFYDYNCTLMFVKVDVLYSSFSTGMSSWT